MGAKTYLITLALPLFYSACTSQQRVPLTQKAAYQQCGGEASALEELLERGSCLKEKGSYVLALQDLEKAKNLTPKNSLEYTKSTK